MADKVRKLNPQPQVCSQKTKSHKSIKLQAILTRNYWFGGPSIFCLKTRMRENKISYPRSCANFGAIASTNSSSATREAFLLHLIVTAWSHSVVAHENLSGQWVRIQTRLDNERVIRRFLEPLLSGAKAASRAPTLVGDFERHLFHRFEKREELNRGRERLWRWAEEPLAKPATDSAGEIFPFSRLFIFWFLLSFLRCVVLSTIILEIKMIPILHSCYYQFQHYQW